MNDKVLDELKSLYNMYKDMEFRAEDDLTFHVALGAAMGLEKAIEIIEKRGTVQ